MVTQFKHFLISFSFATFLVVSGCKKDPCEDVSCAHGTCLDGNCQCEPGYSGTFCEINDCLPNCVNGSCDGSTCVCVAGYEGLYCNELAATKFLGNYTLTEVCSPVGGRTYDVSITSYVFSPTVINLVYLDNSIFTCTANITSPNTFSIPIQSFSGGGSFISGYGSISASGDTVSVTYTTSNSCSAILVRK